MKAAAQSQQQQTGSEPALAPVVMWLCGGTWLWWAETGAAATGWLSQQSSNYTHIHTDTWNMEHTHTTTYFCPPFACLLASAWHFSILDHHRPIQYHKYTWRGDYEQQQLAASGAVPRQQHHLVTVAVVIGAAAAVAQATIVVAVVRHGMVDLTLYDFLEVVVMRPVVNSTM